MVCFIGFMVKSTAPHVQCITVMIDIPTIVYIFVIYIIGNFVRNPSPCCSMQSQEDLSEDIHLVVVDLHV